jgi:MFS superfamily sulfate permease-like transporter
MNGLYTAFVPLLIYAIFASSPVLSIGTGALVSLIVGAHVDCGCTNIPTNASVIVHAVVVECECSNDATTTAVALGFLVGIIHLGLGYLQFGEAIHFFSRPVLSGFITGGAVIIIAAQAKHLLGLDHLETSRYVILEVATTMRNLSHAKIGTTFFGIFAMFVIKMLGIVKERVQINANPRPGQSRVHINSYVATLLARSAEFSALIVGSFGRSISLHLPRCSLYARTTCIQ